jgi:hypothetical protein
VFFGWKFWETKLFKTTVKIQDGGYLKSANVLWQISRINGWLNLAIIDPIQQLQLF